MEKKDGRKKKALWVLTGEVEPACKATAHSEQPFFRIGAIWNRLPAQTYGKVKVA